MLTNHKLLTVIVATIIFLALGASVTASGFVNTISPEKAQVPAIVPPLLAPPNETGYVNRPSNSVIVAPDSRPVAQLDVIPAELAQSIAVNFPPGSPNPNAPTVSYQILSSVRYKGSGHTLLVTTARPSLAASQQPSTLGNQTIQLNDGSMAWVTTGMLGDLSNQLVFVRDDLIITLVSNLPLGTLKDLATKVVIKSNK